MSELPASALLICVHYRGAAEVRQLLEDLAKQEARGALQVVVVDNSHVECPGLLDGLPHYDLQVQVLPSASNLGYFGAADLALRTVAASGGLPDWVVVSNADIRIPGQDFLQRLRALYGEDAPAILAPTIIGKGGLDQNPFLRERPSPARIRFYRWLFRHYLLNLAYQSVSLAKLALLGAVRAARPTARNESGAQQIYAPHGAFVLLHRSYFEAGGSLRHGAFLFGEEIFLAETARRLGLTVLYEPRLRVQHDEHQSIGRLPSRRMSDRMAEAADFLACEFFPAEPEPSRYAALGPGPKPSD